MSEAIKPTAGTPGRKDGEAITCCNNGSLARRTHGERQCINFDRSQRSTDFNKGLLTN